MVDKFLMLFPRFAIRRIGYHVAKAATAEMVVGYSVSAIDTIGINALDNEVRFTDCIGFGVYLRTCNLDGRAIDAL